jgi:hypothetical protein
MDLTIGNVIYVYVLIKKIFVIVKYLKITNQDVKGYIGLKISKSGLYNKTKYIGRYENLEDAIKARQEASKKYYGDFAND